MRAELPLDETPEHKKEKEDATEKLGPLLERVKSVLGDKVTDVRVSDRLTDSPCCLVLSGAGPHAYVDRLLRERGRDVPKAKRLLEVNASHPIVEALAAQVKDDANAERVRDWIEVLYDQARLTEGSPIEDPGLFARRVTRMMVEAAGAAPPKPA
jgi:molecular chaperone HtpG